jgi:CRP-like cAMP-binding protein
MPNTLEILKKIKLFNGINENLEVLLQCLGSEEKRYSKNDVLILTGSPILSVGVLLSGELQIIQNDYLGNSNLLTTVHSGHLFGEAFACAGISESPVTIISKTDSHVLYLGVDRIVNTCPSSCQFHTQLIENLLKVLARKNILLNDKNQLLSQRTTKNKILSFLSLQSEKKGTSQFEIPFSRNELADFLCVDRSALSRSLSQLQKDGIIQYEKNQFTLL